MLVIALDLYTLQGMYTNKCLVSQMRKKYFINYVTSKTEDVGLVD